MKILKQEMGSYQTNCYLLIKNNKTLIIDPGMGAVNWVIKNSVNPIAILNTHGHFDHIWSVKELQEKLHIPAYIHKKDAFLLEKDQHSMGVPTAKADVLVEDDKKIQLEDFEFNYFHAPGHCPGCSMIVFDEAIFSGDFIFDRSIGRYDFPYSDPQDMRSSILKFLNTFSENKIIYPGHGNSTSVKDAKEFLPSWLNYIN